MKKILLLSFLFMFSFSFAQQKGTDDIVVDKKEQKATLTQIAAYPNPLGERTRISFKSSKTQRVEFSVKNLLGKSVYVEQFNCKIGNNIIYFERNNFLKGMYIYTLQTTTEVVSKRLVFK